MPVFSSPRTPAVLPKTSLYNHLRQSDSLYSPESPAFIDGITGEVVTRGAFASQSLSLASGLRNLGQVGGLELHKGSTVTIFSPNSLLYPVALFGLAAAGIRAALTNVSYVDHELAYTIKTSGSTHVLAHFAVIATVVKALESLGHSPEDIKKRVVLLSRKSSVPEDVLAAGWLTVDDLISSETLSLPEAFDGPDAEETCEIYFSSGTTGRSKGVELSHNNITAILEQVSSTWPYYEHGRDVVMAIIPFFHVFGGIILVMLVHLKGIPFVILPRFEPAQFLSALQKFKITVALLVPPLVTFLTKHPVIDKFDLSSLRLIVVGGAPIRAELMAECEARFSKGDTKLVVGEALGMTETSGSISFLPLEHAHAKRGSVGLLLPNMDGKLTDDSGADVAVGEPGELWIRGPNVMKGYIGDVAATQDAITPDGWLKTGDIVTVDADGYMTVIDRKKELIKYKGFQVPPAELESILTAHPEVADAGVIGVYSEEQTTELPRAYVVPRDPSILARDHTEWAASVRAWVDGRVAHHKQLRGGIVLVESIPRAPAGKILRKDLRAKAGVVSSA